MKLLGILKESGVSLVLEKDRLHFRVDAPVGVLSPAIRAELRAHKPALMELIAVTPTSFCGLLEKGFTEMEARRLIVEACHQWNKNDMWKKPI